jgi:hypothetical protein
LLTYILTDYDDDDDDDDDDDARTKEIKLRENKRRTEKAVKGIQIYNIV